MDLAALVARIRDHYVGQFRAFAEQQKASSTKGAAEVKLKLSEHSSVFDRLYCVDFVENNKVVEFQPANILAFNPISGTFGKASFSIEQLRWDDVLVRHDLDGLPSDALSRWFRLWFDPEDARHDPAAELSGTIHSMIVEPRRIGIDFGTADPVAFWDMLKLLEDAGAARIEVSSSRAEPATAD